MAVSLRLLHLRRRHGVSRGGGPVDAEVMGRAKVAGGREEVAGGREVVGGPERRVRRLPKRLRRHPERPNHLRLHPRARFEVRVYDGAYRGYQRSGLVS
jgi:hypothetical protein